MIYHVVVVPESGDYILFFGQAMEFFIGVREGLLYYGCLHDGDTEFTVDRTRRPVGITLVKVANFVFVHFSLPFVRFLTWPRRAMISWRLFWSTQPG